MATTPLTTGVTSNRSAAMTWPLHVFFQEFTNRH